MENREYTLSLMTGVDIPIPECQLVIHQPTLKEISYLGENNFLSAAQCLCLYKTMFKNSEEVLANYSNFSIFLMIMNEEEGKEKKQDVVNLLQVLCPQYKPLFTPRSLLLNSSDSSIIIDESNFESLQKVLRLIFCTSSAANSGYQNFNPSGDKAREIAEKLMRGRKRVAAQSGSSSSSVFTQYISMLTIGINSMSLKDCLDLTIFQLYDLVERYQLYISYDLDIRSRLAGGKPDSKPDNWMKNIH